MDKSPDWPSDGLLEIGRTIQENRGVAPAEVPLKGGEANIPAP